MSTTQPRHLYGAGYGAGKADGTDAYHWRPALRQLASLPSGKRALDAGCENGFF